MTGYQEVLTDPSYAGQIVTMTARSRATTGCMPTTPRAAGWVAGFAVREVSRWVSSPRADATLSGALAAAGVVGIEGSTRGS